MSYPNGPSGPSGNYGPAGGQPQGGAPAFGRPPSAPNPLSRLGMPGMLTLAILVLGLIAYFCSFGGGSGLEVWTLLAGGLLAGLALLPGGPRTLPYATVLSVVGGLAILDSVINGSDGGLPISVILILVFGLIQAAVAILALLLEFELVKLAPRQAVPHAAANYQQPGGNYPPTGGQPQHQANPAQQGTQYMTPQSTQFLQHPGQLSHPQNPQGGNDQV